MIGGKPAYLSGKPIQLIGRQGQIGGLGRWSRTTGVVWR